MEKECGEKKCSNLITPSCNITIVDYLKIRNSGNISETLKEAFLSSYKDTPGIDTFFKESLDILENKRYDEFIENAKRCK